MSTSARPLARVISRPVKNLQKPRPLKASNVSRHSTGDATNLSVFDEIMVLAEAIASNLSNGNFDRTLQTNIVSLSGLLKNYGQNLEMIYKDQLDRAFVMFRNGCRDENLDYTSRLHLLELIELRAMNWTTAEGTLYYKHKYNNPDVEILSISSLDSNFSSTGVFQGTQLLNSVNTAMSQPLILGPGELVKSSGKFAVPTKIPGKNYCKDEVVIRNADSGKVMGIKGRRVHMIEELSETVISFQRVNPGAKERMVQITGPSEDKIIYAKQLMEETIKRNASPIRTEATDKEKHGSNSSLNSTASDDSLRYGSINDSSKRSTLLHSFSTSDATIGEYKYTVTIGEDTLKITGTNPNLVTIAKLVLDEYFLSETNDYLGCNFEDGTNLFERIFIPDNDEGTYKVHHVVSPGFARSLTYNNHDSSDVTSARMYESENNLKENLSVQERNIDPARDEIEKNKSLSLNEEVAISKTDVLLKSPRKIYSSEKIILLSDSPYSKQTPDNWEKICKLYPLIIKKPPIKCFNSEAYFKERPQENDAINSIQKVGEDGSPDPE